MSRIVDQSLEITEMLCLVVYSLFRGVRLLQEGDCGIFMKDCADKDDILYMEIIFSMAL